MDDEECFGRGVCMAAFVFGFYCRCYAGIYSGYLMSLRKGVNCRVLYAVYAYDSAEEKGFGWEEKRCVEEKGVGNVRRVVTHLAVERPEEVIMGVRMSWNNILGLIHSETSERVLHHP